MGALYILTVALDASAALGGSAESVGSVRKALRASRPSVEARSAYTVHEYQSGPTLIREYVSSSGVVFAVTWIGRAPPDLGTLLGDYAAECQQAEQNVGRQPGRRSRVIKTQNVTMARSGRTGRLWGRAYVDALVPYEVKLDEIQ